MDTSTLTVRDNGSSPSVAEPSTTAPRSARRSLTTVLRRTIAGVAVMLALAGLVSWAPVSTASAATSNGIVCFTQRGGGAFTGQVTSQYWTNAGWANYSSFVLPTSGCQSVYYPTGYYWRFVVSHRGFYGSTGYAYVKSGYYYTLTGVASW
ncbi:hypothetical protein [uncultured Friedmanniella sp.]|uniref:hypothetical protein n=1 Tax=uncultured Friedmanniella sp. TaxID=335381 RepID=UPI0035CAB064